jgi:hypothetical protein
MRPAADERPAIIRLAGFAVDPAGFAFSRGKRGKSLKDELIHISQTLRARLFAGGMVRAAQ